MRVKTVQQAIAVMPYFIDPRLHLVVRQAQQDQGVGGEHQARLQQLGHHFAGARSFQFSPLAVIAGAHQDRHVGVDMAGFLEHRQGHITVVHGNHHQARPFQAHGTEQGATATVAVMHAAVFGGGFLDPFRVVIQGDERLLLIAQKAPDGLPDPAIAADSRR